MLSNKKMKSFLKIIFFSLILLLTTPFFCFCLTANEIVNYINNEITKKIIIDYPNYENLSVSTNIKNNHLLKKIPEKTNFCSLSLNKKPIPIGISIINVNLLDKENKILETKPLIIYITANADFVVTTRLINAKEIIKEADLEIINLEINNKPQNIILKKSAIINKETKVGIPKGSIITNSMIQEVPIIRKGEKITMIYLNNNIQLVLRATALEDGCLGSKINVKLSDSAQVFKGEIIEARKVLVISNN